MGQQNRSDYTIYYGLGCILAAIGGIVATGIWGYQIFTGEAGFSWGILTLLVSEIGITGLLGYAILRIGMGKRER